MSITVPVPYTARRALGTTDAPLAVLDGDARIGALCLTGAHMTTANATSLDWGTYEYCVHCGEVLSTTVLANVVLQSAFYAAREDDSWAEELPF